MVVVTAQDVYNNTATSYGGSVRITSSDPAATLPASSTLNLGTGTFAATLNTVGNQTITATDTTDSSITGTSGSVAISAAAASHFMVSGPAMSTAGNAFSISVTALDPYGNTDTNYAGTAHFTSSDSRAVLPANSTLTSGLGIFSATLIMVGNQSITATDTVNSNITGSVVPVPREPLVTHFAVTAGNIATAGVGLLFTVTAEDQFNNTATSYAGSVQFTSSDTQAGFPGPSALVSGVGVFVATLKTAGKLH